MQNGAVVLESGGTGGVNAPVLVGRTAPDRMENIEFPS